MRRRAMLLVVAMMGALVVGSGVALAASVTCTINPCLGTDDPDNIRGNTNYNEIYAGAGDDLIEPFGGGDFVFGGEGNDIVEAFSGEDIIYGGPDNDGSAQNSTFGSLNLEGSEDGDSVYGGGGNDIIDAAANDGPSQFPAKEPVDYSYGQGGNDRINAVDGNEDIVNCGTGKRDFARIDKLIDTATGCETTRKLED